MAANSGSLTATGSVAIPTKSFNDTLVTFVISGTYGTVTFVFEGTADGTNWFPVAAVRADTYAYVNGTVSPSDNTTRAYKVDGTELANARLRATAVGSGQLDVNISSGSWVGAPFLASQVTNSGTNGSQSFTGDVTLAGGSDLIFVGTTGQSQILMTDNLASALVIGEGANAYLTFITTDSSELVQAQKNVSLVNATTPILTLESGSTNTGHVDVKGKTSGMLKITAADATAQTVTLTTAAQTVGAATYTIPDAAGANQTLVTLALAQTLTNKTLTSPVATGIATTGITFATGGATAITTTRAVTRADSGGVFTTAQSSAYTVTVAQPLGAGERYLFQCVSPGAFDISLVATGCTFEGTITIDASTIPATGSTLKFASGAAILGDNIELISTSTTKFLVRAIGSGAGGITIS